MSINFSRSFLLVIYCIFLDLTKVSVARRIGPGTPCGNPIGSKRFMLKNGYFGCYKCDTNQYWALYNKSCNLCSGFLTNIKPNVRSSCKDERIYSTTISTPTTTTEFPGFVNETTTRYSNLGPLNATTAGILIPTQQNEFESLQQKMKNSTHNDPSTVSVHVSTQKELSQIMNESSTVKLSKQKRKRRKNKKKRKRERIKEKRRKRKQLNRIRKKKMIKGKNIKLSEKN